MAEAKARSAWDRTSLVCALIANANRDPKKSRPYKPADFNPYAKSDTKGRRGIPITPANIELLKVLVKDRRS